MRAWLWEVEGLRFSDRCVCECLSNALGKAVFVVGIVHGVLLHGVTVDGRDY
jgi:hypothetical protein